MTNALIALLVVGIALALLTSLVGALAALLTGAGWAWTSLADAGRALAALPAHAGEPAAAYPLGVRERIPGPVAYWSVTAAVLAGVVTAGAYGTAVWGRRFPRRSRARWAGSAEERRIAVPADPARRACRLVAGRGGHTGRLLAGGDCISAVALGPNGSGKSTALVAPNVLEWAGPVVTTTTKPQDVAVLHSARSDRGPVWVVAPAGCPGYDTAGWSPVDYCVGEEEADRMAEWLVEASGMTGDPKARPWNAQARKYLKGLLLAAHVSGGGIDAFVDWIYAGQRAADDVSAILAGNGHTDVRRGYDSTWLIHDEGKGSVLFTAFGLADTYARPSVRASAQGSVPLCELFGQRPGTLILVAPESEMDRFAPYFTALISAVVHDAETRAAAAAGPLSPRLLLALDEAGNVFRFPRLPNLLTTARGNGIQLLLVYHDLAQLEHVYGGRAVARTVLSNAKLRILLPGVGDLETLRYFSEMLGRQQVTLTGRSRGHDGRLSTSTSESAEDLAPLHLLQQLPADQAVVQYQNLPPMRVRLRFWFRDRHLRRLGGEHG